MPVELLAVTDDIGNTSRREAAATILVSKKPDLLYIPNDFGYFPVQVAALFARKDTLQYLISVTEDDFGVNPYAGSKGLELLHFVIEADYFGELICTSMGQVLLECQFELEGVWLNL
ncbi:UNVERIFIED_CONTAM: hypothetical protein Slati_3728700 [Sesamum latifolium]|uniref:Ankyrin repeat family protein n=1 Tax=Sesamum latifolium TaxID=2727402 RepID=A0AAW2U4G7_9LAMI